MKQKITLKNVLILQAVIVVYTLSGVMAAIASRQKALSLRFFLFYLAELVILGIYALLWQQMIKRFELSVAYANRAMALLWSLVWSVVIFHDRVTPSHIIGVGLVILGTVIINGGQEEEAEHEH